VNPRPAVKRQYQSRLREAQANATRRTVVDAAARLFIEHGYGATSIDAIAEEAGVGRATVFTSAGGKASLLKAAYDIAVVGDDEPVPLPQRPWAQHVRAAPTAREMVIRYAAMVTQVDGRVAKIYEALRGAASADPEVRALWDEIQTERLGGARNVVRMLREKGRLRAGLDDRAAADIVWVLIDPGLYDQFVHRRAWTAEQFGAWMATTMQEQLLPPRRTARR
jgi:AcrR family transcriptional regulator